MRYMLAIYEDEAAYADGMEGEAWRAILRAHTALVEEMQKAGVLAGGCGLQPAAATTVRTGPDGVSVHEGPFAETREQLGGYYLVDVTDLDAAIAWARRIPLAGGGAVEIRPALDDGD